MGTNTHTRAHVRAHNNTTLPLIHSDETHTYVNLPSVYNVYTRARAQHYIRFSHDERLYFSSSSSDRTEITVQFFFFVFTVHYFFLYTLLSYPVLKSDNRVYPPYSHSLSLLLYVYIYIGTRMIIYVHREALARVIYNMHTLTHVHI